MKMHVIGMDTILGFEFERRPKTAHPSIKLRPKSFVIQSTEKKILKKERPQSVFTGSACTMAPCSRNQKRFVSATERYYSAKDNHRSVDINHNSSHGVCDDSLSTFVLEGYGNVCNNAVDRPRCFKSASRTRPRSG